MSIVNRIIVDDSVDDVNQRRIIVDYVFHTSEIVRLTSLLDELDDAQTIAQLKDDEAIDNVASREVSLAVNQTDVGEIIAVPEHQLQADFDRRVLGRMMMYVNVHNFLNGYSFFQAVELRGGANANQRAAYLGITTEDYGLIDDRFSNVNGVAWFITDEKAMLWQELPVEFK